MNILFISYLMLGTLFLSWDQADVSAEQKHPEEVVIRGFVYHAKNGEWVLSPEPNLRSCCVGATHKIAQQIVLKGDFSKTPAHQVISVKGQLLAEIDGDKQRMVMEKASEFVQENESNSHIFLLAGGVICGLVLYPMIRQKRPTSTL